MKARVTLEFDLENHDGSPVTSADDYEVAASDAETAIRRRLMGVGFLPDELLIGTYSIKSEIVKEEGQQ